MGTPPPTPPPFSLSPSSMQQKIEHIHIIAVVETGGIFSLHSLVLPWPIYSCALLYIMLDRLEKGVRVFL